MTDTMKGSAYYRARAEEARMTARQISRLDQRDQYLRIADSWLTLANEAERREQEQRLARP